MNPSKRLPAARTQPGKSRLPMLVGLLLFMYAGHLSGQSAKRLNHFRLEPPAINDGLLASPANRDADIVLTKVPGGMLLDGDPEDEELIEWQEKISCVLRFDTKPGNRDLADNYPDTAEAQGKGSLSLNPFNEGMRTGFYYCILVSEEDSSRTSVEFKVIVEANAAPRTLSPRGAISLQQGAPLFEWDPVAGVPYYLVFVSEGAIRIERDENDEVSGLAGLNLTWQVITSESFLKFGEPDPVGNFANAYIPPLLEGINYNWIVLNSYGPNPDFVSTKIAPVAPSAFTVTRQTLAEAPSLIAPATNDSISGDEIEFSWNPVAGALRYRLFLYQTGEFAGNTIKFTMWSRITHETRVHLKTKGLLVTTDFSWRVLAERDDQVSHSELRPFRFNGDAGWAKFIATSEEGALGRVRIAVRNQAEVAALLPAQTDTLGLAKVALPVGDYSYVPARTGFETAQRGEFTIADNDTQDVKFTLLRGNNTISGRVLTTDGDGLFAAVAEITSSNSPESVNTDENGYFTFAVADGNYSLRIRKVGYVASQPMSLPLSPGETLDIGEVVLRAATNSVSGQVSFSADSRPLQGTVVRAQGLDLALETTTGNQGGFRLRPGPGTWRITVDSQGYYSSPAEYTFTLGENDQVSAPFQLQAGGLLHGQVRFGDTPLEGARVEAVSEGQVIQTTATDVQGAYELGLLAGDYEMVVSRQNFLTVRSAVTIADETTQLRDFSLTEAGFVAGAVFNTDTDGPAENWRIVVVADTTVHAFTDAQGNYLLGLTPDISHQLDAVRPGFESNGPKSVTTRAGQTVDGPIFLVKALSGIIKGQVTDSFGPLIGASVAIPALDLPVALTDENGKFSFADIKPGDYTLEVNKECYFGKTVSISLTDGTLTLEPIVLKPFQSAVTGRVIDAFGAPISEAQIKAEGDTLFTALSDANGDYELCLNSGIFRLTAARPGYFDADTALVINDGDFHTGVDFVLRESFANISGTVQDTSGAPVAQAVVELNDFFQTLRDTTDATGAYNLNRIVPGRVTIRASRQGFFGLSESVFLQDQERSSLDLVLYPSDGFIRGAVRDSSQATGIPQVTLKAAFSDSDDDFFTAITGSDGAYSLKGLPVVPNSSFGVLAFKGGFLSLTSWHDVAVNSENIDFFMIDLNAVIAGFVQDSDTGESVAGVRVEAAVTDGGSRSVTVTDSIGRFELLQLASSKRYNLTASREGFFTTTLSDIAPGDTSLIISLERKYGFVRGKTTDLSDMSPSANVPVVATAVNGGNTGSTMSGLDGEYLLRLVPDSYTIEPRLAHYHSEPVTNFGQIQVAALDTVTGIDFLLEEQQVATINVRRADLDSRPSISNGEQHCYTTDVRDRSGRPVDIGAPDWHLSVSRKAARIDTGGCLTLNPGYFGDLTIVAQDRRSGVQGELRVKVFAAIDSTTNVILFDDRGLQMQVFRSSVLSKKEMQVTRQPLAPAKKGRAEFFTTDSSYTLKPTNLTFNGSVRLMLKPPANTAGQKRHIAKWDDVENAWQLLASADEAGVLAAKILDTGEYLALAFSRPLAVENLSMLPNPFSPFVGRGLELKFDISSAAAPAPLLTIKIYNLEGNLVRLLHDQTPFQRGPTIVNWDGMTDNRAMARNGRYLVRIIVEDPTEKRDVMKSVVLIK